MAILQVKSTNPKFSYMIRKNPLSGLAIKGSRKGHSTGWFNDKGDYNVFFKDAANDVSYPSHENDSFEYINTTRYNSVLFVINTISDYFRDNLKKVVDFDTGGFSNQITVNMVFVKTDRYLKFFNKYFEDFSIEHEEVGFKNYRLTFKSEKTLHELLNFVSLFVVFNALRNEAYFPIDDQIVAKYISSLKIIDAPYFIRYIFKTNFLRNKKSLEKYRSILEHSLKEKIELELGSTQDMRLRSLKDKLCFDRDIVDIGCGEGSYALPFSREIPEKMYYAIDRDEKCRLAVKRKKERKNLDNVTILESFEDYNSTQRGETPVDVLLTEVIEHNTLESTEKLVDDVFALLPIHRILMTTPNKDFNEFYYFEEDQMRHEDHVFEFSKEEFHNWVNAKVVRKGFKVMFFDIGDKVNGVPVTLGAVVTPKD